MTIRTSSRTVRFTRPFRLSGVSGVHPAGAYVVETQEELLDTVSVVAYRRISTSIQVPAESGRAGSVETHFIEPAAVDAALIRDIARA
jgi:hypothetical protein